MTSSWRELIQPAVHAIKNRMASVPIAAPWYPKMGARRPMTTREDTSHFTS